MAAWLKKQELRLKSSGFFAFRKGAKRVFYPGCSLPGADPGFSLKVYRKLLELDSEMGIWFDCCAKPLRMQKDSAAAEKGELALLASLQRAGVEEVITACANCFEQFSLFASGKIKVRMIYDLLHAMDLQEGSSGWTMHHPCFVRVKPDLQESVFHLTDQQGFGMKNRRQQGHPLPCCLHKTPAARRSRKRLQGEKLLTYCAHCVMSFQQDIPTRHLLQELLGSTATWRRMGKVRLFANYRRFCRLLKGD